MKFRQPYHDLELWKLSDSFVKEVYRLSKKFPNDERFGVTSQLRRASLSVVLNIVEGHARSTKKDFARFLIISRASLAECSYLLELSLYLGYLDEKAYNDIENLRRRTGFLLYRFILSLRKS